MCGAFAWVPKMIPNELAKRLKEAGFIWPNMDNLAPSRPDGFPSLSELIEACGSKFSSLESIPGGFQAAGYGQTRMEIADGKTPEEALARLLIALQKAA